VPEAKFVSVARRAALNSGRRETSRPAERAAGSLKLDDGISGSFRNPKKAQLRSA
jgi:hypothetical protein